MEKKNIIKYDGVLELGNITLDCYVLQDGTRVLSGNGMQTALNMVDEGEQNPSGTRLARYMGQKTLEPYILKAKQQGHFQPIICWKGEQKINGYNALALIDICDAFLQARKEIKLSSRQTIIAEQCEMLVRSFAKVGLIALIDEATKYQYDRESKELQAILKALIGDEIEGWQRQFNLSFYKEIYKLWGIPFTPKNIKYKPQFIGHITNKYVYGNLPMGESVLKELKSRTPKTAKGNYKYKLHQWLTKDEGREMLKKVLNTVEGFASISESKAEFDRMIQKKYGQQSLSFPDFDPYKEEETKEDLQKLSVFNQKLKQGLEYNPKQDKK